MCLGGLWAQGNGTAHVNERGAMTTLRNAQLLNAHALILAEKVNPRDMAEYDGLISFVNVAQVLYYIRDQTSLLCGVGRERERSTNERPPPKTDSPHAWRNSPTTNSLHLLRYHARAV